MNLNKVYLIGRLTQEPEARSTPSGQNVTTIRMATNRVWNDPTTKQKKEATEFHTVIAWGRLGEIASQYLRKGAMVMIEGRMQTRSWEDKTTSSKRYATEVIAENLQMGPRAANDQGGYTTPTRTPSASSGPSAPIAPRSIPTLDSEIPIIDENELTSSGVEETTIKDIDLPF